MNDLLDDFRQYFTGLSLTVLEEVFLDTYPDKPDELVAISEYGGNSGLPQIASSLRSIQIFVRSKDAGVARERALALYHSLETDDGIVNLTDIRWTMVSLRQPPFKMKVDTQDRTYFAFNAGVTTYND